MDSMRLRAVVETIPPGRWSSYADVVAAAGGAPRQAIGVNQRLTRAAAGGEPVAGAHRVLKADGSIPPGALGDPDAVRTLLVAEGLDFQAGRAAQEARFKPAPLPSEEQRAPQPDGDAPQTPRP